MASFLEAAKQRPGDGENPERAQMQGLRNKETAGRKPTRVKSSFLGYVGKCFLLPLNDSAIPAHSCHSGTIMRVACDCI